MLQRLALYATLGLVLDAVELGFSTMGFWLILALFICVEHVTRTELIEQLNQELRALRRAQQESEEAANGNNKH